MNKITEAVVVLSKCGEVHKTYGIRAEKKAANSWEFTWAFPIKVSSAKREGYDKTNVGGYIQCSEDYPGCPFCGRANFVVCNCGHISCKIVQGDLFACEWCGTKGTIVDYTGEAIKAGVDL